MYRQLVSGLVSSVCVAIARRIAHSYSSPLPTTFPGVRQTVSSIAPNVYAVVDFH